MAVLKRPVGNAVFALGGLAVILAVVVGTGRGGGEDGALGIGIALAIMIGGAVCIQRLGRVRVLLGFNPDGLWSPSTGWVEWAQVRHIELRQRSNPVTGRHHTLWIRYVPSLEGEQPGSEVAVAGDPPAEVWFDARPGMRQARILAVVEAMEQCWKAAVAGPPLSGGPASR